MPNVLLQNRGKAENISAQWRNRRDGVKNMSTIMARSEGLHPGTWDFWYTMAIAGSPK